MTRWNGKESGIQEIHCKTMDLQHVIHRMLATIIKSWAIDAPVAREKT
jgi:hypothetical protein